MPRVICSIACLPHERHVSGKRVAGTPIVDTNRVFAGHLDFRVVAQADVHDVGSRCRSESLGDGRGGTSIPSHSARRIESCDFLVPYLGLLRFL